jgi:UrcA family protein
MLKTITAFAAVLVASSLVLPTVSQAAEPNSVRVTYADLNLASDFGQRSLEHRIVRAAKIVCVYDEGKDVRLNIETNACRSDAIARVQPAYAAAVNAARRGTVTVIGGAASLIVTAR